MMMLPRFILSAILATLLFSRQAMNRTVYHIVSEYYQYHDQFKRMAGQKNVVEMTMYGTGKQLCNKTQPCRFYNYVYEPENKSNIKYTLLITSGMHGDELIGPTSLLYAFPLLQPKSIRIIYFPIMNPSGYQLKKRETYPDDIDINRDYPIDKNVDCYMSSATRIIDHIFRMYKIDMTLNLHNGGDQIGWNWGTYYNMKMPQTQDEIIYSSIGSMLKKVGGQNTRLGIKRFKIGVMSKIIYPAIGTLDDWAYSASWSQSTPPQCKNYKYTPYPKDLHSGLVFIFELGRKNIGQNQLGTSQGLQDSPVSGNIKNGYVTRALRMLIQVVNVISPTINFELRKNTISINVLGCKNISDLTVKLVKNGKQQNISKRDVNFSQKDDIFEHTGYIHAADLGLSGQGEITIQYNVRCDDEWKGKGKSFMAKPREFHGTFKLNPEEEKQEELKQKEEESDFSSEQLNYLFQTVVVIGLFILFAICLCRRKTSQIKKYFKEQSNQVNEVNQESPEQSYAAVDVEMHSEETKFENQSEK